MNKVITVTLNPSLDRTMITHYMNPGYPNRTSEPTRLDPGGHGVNISRALYRLGSATNAVILLGSDATGRAYRALIAEEGFSVTFIAVDGLTRSNIVIVDTGNKTETNIFEESSVGREEDLDAIAKTLDGVIEAGDMVVFAGDLTSEAPIDTFERLTRNVQGYGARVMLVTSGDALGRALRAAPDMIALTRQEMEGVLNFPVRTAEDVIYSAGKLRERGAGQVFVTMFGDEQAPAAVMVTEEDTWQVIAPETETEERTGTLSGVYDAFVAGLLSGMMNDQSMHDSLRLSAAAGSFTATKVGSEFPTMEDLRESLEAIRVIQMRGKAENNGV
jgi:1-phosphofructokinase family hexose kinase